MRRLACAVALIAVTACASMVDRPVAARVGLHIDQVIRQMGYPASERTIAGKHIYAWQREVGFEGNQLQCEVTYEVDGAGVVIDYDWHGQFAACETFVP